MSDKLRVIFNDKQKEVKIQTGIRILLRRCCHAILEDDGFKGSVDVYITFTDNEELDALCMERGLNTEAEVLSVPTFSDGEYEINADTGVRNIGELFISMPRAAGLATKHNVSFRRHLTYIVANGVYELLGYSDDDVFVRDERRARTELVMSRLGLPVTDYYYDHE